MRAAPPVSVRGNGGPAWRAVQAALPGLATAALLCWALPWVLRMAPAAAVLAGIALPAAAAVGWLVWRLLEQAVPQLSWSGQDWTLVDMPDAQPASRTAPPAAVQGRLDVMVDLGIFMLLRLSPAAGRQRWMAITAREAGVHWHGLRAAAYAHTAPQAVDADRARGAATDLQPPEAAR